MSPMVHEGLLEGILFENPDEIALLAASVGRFAAHNAELCSFVNTWAGRLATSHPMNHPHLAGKGTKSYDLLVPVEFAADVITSIVSAGIKTPDYTVSDTQLAGTMIEQYWGLCQLGNS